MSHPLTPQAAFNKVAKHLLKQGEKSVNEEGACVYRGPRGLRCAVGALIPRRITPKEGRNVSSLLFSANPKHRCAAWVEHIGGKDVARDLLPLLCELQYIHDRLPVERWRDALRNAAISNNLSPAVLEAAQ